MNNASARVAPGLGAQINSGAPAKFQEQRSGTVSMSMGGNPYQNASFQVSTSKNSSFLTKAAVSNPGKQAGRSTTPYMMLGGAKPSAPNQSMFSAAPNSQMQFGSK